MVTMSKKTTDKADDQPKKPIVYGDPEYSAGDDIYSKGEKIELDESGEGDEKVKGGAKNRRTGEDLDVPGSELDDADEKIGEEDEENNYYSLGGDDHDDLEEDKGE
jgi:hypothetical protein